MTTTSEQESIERDLEAAFAAPVPELKFEAGRQAPTSARPVARRRGWGFAGAAALAAGLVATVAYLPGFLGGAEPVNAQELLTRSADASAQLQSSTIPYHLKAKYEGTSLTSDQVKAAASGGEQPGYIQETWAFGTDGNRSEMRSIDGAILNGQVARPGEFWMFATVDGTLRVAHLGSGTARLNDFEDATTFDGVVRGMEIPGCQAATLTGSEVVAGRETYVVDVRPTPATCSGDSGNPATAKTAAFIDDLGGFTVWIDKETNVQLKSEKRDASGTVVSRYTTLTFETGAAVDRSVLAFTPPSGATVVEVSDYTNAKHAIYDGTSEGRPAKGAP